MDDIDALKKELADLQQRVEFLQEKRVLQSDILPDSVKTRAMGEANRYIFSGLEASRPAGHNFGNTTTVYFAMDTLKLYVWDGSAWHYALLT